MKSAHDAPKQNIFVTFVSNKTYKIYFMIDLNRFSINQAVDDRTFRQSVFAKREQLINVATCWSGNTNQGSYIFHNIWKSQTSPIYIVSMGKYGKEYYQAGATGHGVKNCQDMRPTIICENSVVTSVKGGFDDIFKLMEHCKEVGKAEVLKAFAVLFFRNALLLDHDIVSNKYSYNPPLELITFICNEIPQWEGVPMEVYIHFLDAIGYNEDVKYKTQGRLSASNGIGRENNMKTYVYIICCILGLENWSDFIYKLMRNYGVAAITNSMIAKNFPELNISFTSGTQRKRKKGAIDIEYNQIFDEMP